MKVRHKNGLSSNLFTYFWLVTEDVIFSDTTIHILYWNDIRKRWDVGIFESAYYDLVELVPISATLA
jgi:hypothetical protein